MERAELIDRLKRGANKRVHLTFSEGESLVADLDLVLEDEDAVVFDLVASNKPDSLEFQHIVRVRSIREEREAGR